MIFWTTLLVIHGLIALALLGAITHQSAALWWPARDRAGSFVARFRAVPSKSYVNAIILLYVIAFILGAPGFTRSTASPLGWHWSSCGFSRQSGCSN